MTLLGRFSRWPHAWPERSNRSLQWRVHFRNTEACIEVRPYNFWNALLEGLALRQEQPNSSHLLLAGRTVTQVPGKRVHVRLDVKAVRACVSHPPWIERETYDYRFS